MSESQNKLKRVLELAAQEIAKEYTDEYQIAEIEEANAARNLFAALTGEKPTETQVKEMVSV